MEINQTPPAFSAMGSPTVDASVKSKISSDFDTFLRMLTVQLENQDPLNPVDSADYAVQLATFSGVEQQVQTNDLLSRLLAEGNAAGLAQLAGWVGKEAMVPGVGYWDGTPVAIEPKIDAGATSAQLLVRNANGVEVSRQSIPLNGDPISWAGKDAEGQSLPFGTYRFDIVNFEGDTPMTETAASVYTRVTEVRSEAGVSSIVIKGGHTVPSSDVTALRDPAG